MNNEDRIKRALEYYDNCMWIITKFMDDTKVSEIHKEVIKVHETYYKILTEKEEENEKKEQ